MTDPTAHANASPSDGVPVPPTFRPVRPRGIARWLECRQGGVAIAVLFALAVGLATRLALLGASAEEVAWNGTLLAAFGLGTVYDFAAALWWAAPLALVLALLPARFFASPWGRGLAHGILLLILGLLLFGAVAEWVFWEEFGARFNFIAVDYLVYTTEVVGNIRESYPMPAIYAGLLLASLAGYALFLRTGWSARWLAAATEASGRRWRGAGLWIVAPLLVGTGLRQSFIPDFANNYNRELAKDGLWSLFAAFQANQLDYEGFYPTMPIDAAFQRVQAMLAREGGEPLQADPHDLLRLVKGPGPELRLNVIQITVESLSAEFLGRFGNRDNLTPHLDALAPQALVFENLYATGTRTDRGMEALTLSVPPTPGRSLIKRPGNEHLFTLGSVFRSRGYATAFVYGGFGYFDNMNYFFGENGYRVVDRTSVPKEDITFANVWGACDEDLFRWELREADRDHAAGRPFFHFLMTTSNHRPFTFPAGKIDLPSKDAGRAGGVKYTDHAIGELLRAAAQKPWFRNTIFVIVADHCASSAGRTELPVERYHIPMLIYAPGGQVKPGVVTTLASQIDFAPTLLGLLHWTYPSRFYGRDLLDTAHPQPGRALVGNYQKLGLYRAGGIGVLKPVRESLAYAYNPANRDSRRQPVDGTLIDDAIAYYQTASWLFKHGGHQELSAAEQGRFARQETPAPTVAVITP